MVTESEKLPGLFKKLRWAQFKTDLQQYDLLEHAQVLKMPVVLVVGEDDTGTPPAHHKLLFEQLTGPKELHVLPGISHTIKQKWQLDEIKKVVGDWNAKL